MDPWYLTNLVCPRDHLGLRLLNNSLICERSHAYPIVDHVPVMLLDDVRQTMDIVPESLRSAKDQQGLDESVSDFSLESLGVSEEEKKSIVNLIRENTSKVDPVVAYLIGATNGNMYNHLIGRLDSYPIPRLRLPNGDGQTFLDLGCSWGRWCIAASRKGYEVVGVDPSLGAIKAAQRVSASFGLSIKYLVADARYLPFARDRFQNIFSYSVLQHLSREDVGLVLSEVARTLDQGGVCLIQMPTNLGVRCLYHQISRRFREATDFEVRYWSIPDLKRLFTNAIGQAEVSVDCYFGIGLQAADYEFMTKRLRLVLAGSEMLRGASHFAPFLKYAADSVYVKAVKP